MISFEDAMEVVEDMEVNMAYFTLSPNARAKAGMQLMAMVNWPPDRVVKNGHGEVIPYVTPKERLAWLSRQLMKVKTWPGMGEVRGLYCLRFTPADGIEADCTLPGVTDDGRFMGEDAIGIDAPPEEQPYLPQPGDEPIGDDFRAMVAGAAKKLNGGAR